MDIMITTKIFDIETGKLIPFITKLLRVFMSITQLM